MINELHAYLFYGSSGYPACAETEFSKTHKASHKMQPSRFRFLPTFRAFHSKNPIQILFSQKVRTFSRIDKQPCGLLSERAREMITFEEVNHMFMQGVGSRPSGVCWLWLTPGGVVFGWIRPKL